MSYVRFLLLMTAALAFLTSKVGTAAEIRSYGAYHEHIDTRHGHNRNYADPGVVLREVPREAIVVHDGPRRYWFNGGMWYRPEAGRFVVIAPPLGVFVPILPPFYTTLFIGGLTYYYANDAYYLWRDAEHEYEVVQPPADAAATVTNADASGSNDVYVYPKNGQSAEQQAKDRYECYRWGSGQTGFDPTQSGGGVSAGASASKRAEYQRALSACLEARGYTVR